MTCFRSRRAVLVDLCKDGCWSITTVLLRSFPIAVVPDEKSFKIAIGKEWVFFWTALPPAQTNIDVLGGSSVLLCNPAAIISPQICSYFGVKAVFVLFSMHLQNVVPLLLCVLSVFFSSSANYSIVLLFIAITKFIQLPFCPWCYCSLDGTPCLPPLTPFNYHSLSTEDVVSYSNLLVLHFVRCCFICLYDTRNRLFLITGNAFVSLRAIQWMMISNSMWLTSTPHSK